MGQNVCHKCPAFGSCAFGMSGGDKSDNVIGNVTINAMVNRVDGYVFLQLFS
jgi:hypothetical protein